MKTIKIQSISDLITNSSTEVFVVYDESNINSIKELVNAILSLLDSSKTFDDYFNIEMSIDYDEIDYLFIDNCKDELYYDRFPEFKIYNGLSSQEARKNYIESLSINRLKEITDWANDENSWGEYYQLYEGFIVTAKNDDPIVKKVAHVINGIDNIFNIDYSCN